VEVVVEWRWQSSCGGEGGGSGSDDCGGSGGDNWGIIYMSLHWGCLVVLFML
jgi:hypothetical protein